MSVKIKARNRILEITEKDVVMFNGACWQLLSQTYRDGFSELYPSISAIKCKKWIKKGALILVTETGLYKTSSGKQMGRWYYKFNVEILKELEEQK